MTLALCGYSIVSAVFAFDSLQRRFYVAPEHRLAYEKLLRVDSACSQPGRDFDPEATVVVHRNRPFTLCGWALDSYVGAPALAVFAQVDQDRQIRTTYGLPRVDVVEALLDDRFLNSGFRVSVTMDKVDSGIHSLRFLVLERDRQAFGLVALRIKVVD